MPFEDKTIVCDDCGAEFIHSAEDQDRYAQRGFTNDPKRCRDCREKRKTSMSGGRRSGGGGGGREPRESYDAVCAQCGATTTVPFKPTQGRPVYCRDCFRDQRNR